MSAGLILLVLSLCLGFYSSQQPDDESAVRKLVESYYASYSQRDSDKLFQLWSPRSPDLTARRETIKKFLAENDRIEVKTLAFRQVKIAGEQARVRIGFELSAVDVKTGKPSTGLGKRNRTFHLVREEGNWKVSREESTEDEISRALGAVGSDGERAALMAAEKEFLTEQLVRLVQSQGTRLREGGKSEEAHAKFLLTQALADFIDLKNVRASVNIDFGNIHFGQGEYAPALESYEKAVKLGELWGEKKVCHNALINIGLVHYMVGDFSQSLENLGRALKIAESLDDKRGIAAALSATGFVLNVEGNLGEAALVLRRSLALGESLGDKRAIAAAWDSIASLYFAQGEYNQAVEATQKSIALAEEMNFKIGVATAYSKLGSIHKEREDYPQAIASFHKSLEITPQTDKALTANTMLGLADVHLEQGDHAKALEYAQRSSTLSEEIRFKPHLANSQQLISRINNALGDHRGALAAADRAATLAREIGNVDLVFKARTAAGVAHRALNQPELARLAFEEAIGETEALRARVSGGERERQQFFEARVAAYHEMVSLLLTMKRTAEAFSYAERAKARTILDVVEHGRSQVVKAMTAEEQQQERRFKTEMASLNAQVQGELQAGRLDSKRLSDLRGRLRKSRIDYELFKTSLYAAHPELRVQRVEMQSINAEEARELVTKAGAGGALAEFVVTDEVTHLFVLTADGLKSYTLPVKRHDLKRRVNDFRRLMADRRFEFQPAGRELYDLLLGPARAELRGKTSLVIIPDDALWELPFQALLTTSSRYLIEDSAISYAPSLTALREMKARNAKRASSAAATLLAFGNPALDARTVDRARPAYRDERLEPLPEAEREVKTLGDWYGASRSRVYVGSEAREDRVKAEAGNYRILHFATHGVLNKTAPLYSHLVLSPGDKNNDGLLEAWEFMEMDLNADLVVLSGCETGRGRVGRGEGLIGLSWALFVGGAQSTLVSQWKVDSTSTTRLILEFYRANRNPGMTSARALQSGARRMLRDPSTRHPFYWAGFVLIGEGGVGEVRTSPSRKRPVS